MSSGRSKFRRTEARRRLHDGHGPGRLTWIVFGAGVALSLATLALARWLIHQDTLP